MVEKWSSGGEVVEKWSSGGEVEQYIKCELIGKGSLRQLNIFLTR